MSDVVEEVKEETVANPSCANCWAHSDTDPEPEDWATVLIAGRVGILTNSLLCPECLTAIKQALAGRRPVAEATKEVVPEAPVVTQQEAQEEDIAPTKPQQSARRRKGQASAPTTPVVEEKPVDSPPIEEVAPAEALPVQAGAPADSAADDVNASENK